MIGGRTSLLGDMVNPWRDHLCRTPADGMNLLVLA